MEVILIWLLFSIPVGILASNRGRSGVGWFLFSLLLSPLLGLIVVLVLTNLQPHRAPQASEAATEHRIKCPECRELVLHDARKCKHCGSSLTPQLVTEPPQQPERTAPSAYRTDQPRFTGSDRIPPV